MDIRNFSSQEKTAIIQFREIMKNQKSARDAKILDDDLILYKFLKARNFNLDQAARMLRKNIENRRENQTDRILLDYKPPEVIELYMTQSFLGFDKEGSPVRYSAIGNLDTHGIFKSTTFQDIIRSAMHFIESDIQKTKEQSKKLNKTVSQFVFIFNLENLTIAKALDKNNLEYFKMAVTLFQDNYPERLKKVFAINAPSFFSVVFTIVKTVLANELLKKVKVYGSDGWKEALLEDIDDEVLPAFLGGKKTGPDGDPLCKTFINHGYIVPEKYYFINSKKEFSSLTGIVKLTVKKHSREEICVDVERTGSFIEWEFKVKSKDIGFGLALEFHDNGKTEIENLITVKRVETPISTASGKYYCYKEGKYTIIFDNSHSLMTSKEVFYKVVIN